MDPNANLREQEEILTALATTLKGIGAKTVRRRLRELRDALTGWLQGQGFAPDWAKCPKAAKYYGHGPTGIYCTSFCNFGHSLKTGRPIGHECYILDPKALQAERDGTYVPNIIREPRQLVIGRKARA